MFNKLSKGILIAFEGIDGSGKSTQAKILHQALADKALPVVITKEPSDSLWGKKIRELCFNERTILSPEEELELFIKDRKEHVDKVISPSLEKRKIVITDRYYYSTIAYQGALGLDIDNIKFLNRNMPVPDIVIYLNIDPFDSIKRIKESRNDVPNQFEREDYLKDVKKIFDNFKEKYFYKIDGALSQAIISKKVIYVVNSFIK